MLTVHYVSQQQMLAAHPTLIHLLVVPKVSVPNLRHEYTPGGAVNNGADFNSWASPVCCDNPFLHYGYGLLSLVN